MFVCIQVHTVCITQLAAVCLIYNVGVVEGYEWFQQLGRIKDYGLYC